MHEAGVTAATGIRGNRGSVPACHPSLRLTPGGNEEPRRCFPV